MLARCGVTYRRSMFQPSTALSPSSLLTPPPRRPLFAGINNRIKAALSAREESKLDQKFEKLSTSLLATDRLTLLDWKLQIDERMSDWRVRIGSKLPGVRDSEGVVRVQQQLAIMSSFSEEELQGMHSMTTKVKNRVTQKAGVSERVAGDFFKQFLDMQELHEWLHSRKSRGVPLPQTMAAAQDMIAQDRANPALGLGKKTMAERRKDKKEKKARRSR